jgi:hypothetical protein
MQNTKMAKVLAISIVTVLTIASVGNIHYPHGAINQNNIADCCFGPFIQSEQPEQPSRVRRSINDDCAYVCTVFYIQLMRNEVRPEHAPGECNCAAMAQ